MFALRFDSINSAACIVADLHAILFEPNGNIIQIVTTCTDRRKRLISCYRSCIHVYSWRPVIIVAFDFRTKCAVTDRIETAYIVDDLQLLLFEPNVTCMQGMEIHAYISNQGIRSGGGTQFPRDWVRLIGFVQPGNSVRGTVFPRELGPGGTVFPKGIRSAGPKIGPDRIPYDTGLTGRLAFGTLTAIIDERITNRNKYKH